HQAVRGAACDLRVGIAGGRAQQRAGQGTGGHQIVAGPFADGEGVVAELADQGGQGFAVGGAQGALAGEGGEGGGGGGNLVGAQQFFIRVRGVGGAAGDGEDEDQRQRGGFGRHRNESSRAIR